MQNQTASGGRASLWKQMVKNRSCYYFIAGFVLVFTVFTLIPVLIAVFLSFTNFNVLQPARFIGIENYKNLFLRDSVFATAGKNTFVLAAVTGPISYLLSLFMAWLINEIPRWPRALMTLLCYAPSISGGALFVWTIVFSADPRGYLNAMLYQYGLIDRPIAWLADPKYMMGVCIFVILWMSLGTSFLAFIAGLQGVDKTMYEAAAVGAEPLPGAVVCDSSLDPPAAAVQRRHEHNRFV